MQDANGRRRGRSWLVMRQRCVVPPRDRRAGMSDTEANEAQGIPPATHIERIRLGGVPVDLCQQIDALTLITERALDQQRRPLAVVSVNLDHVHHFGESSPLAGSFGLREGAGAALEWLHLVDGAPIASMARRTTGLAWPRLAGSDLLAPIMSNAEREALTVGFLGGAAETHERLLRNLRHDYPALQVGGVWAPSRVELLETDGSLAIARDVQRSKVDILAVCLGKPRQEVWIDHFGVETGARVLLAFGAAVDFLAARVTRAPEWLSSRGFEWAWRLGMEPRRLAKRYLVQAPAAYRQLRRTPVITSEPPPGGIE